MYAMYGLLVSKDMYAKHYTHCVTWNKLICPLVVKEVMEDLILLQAQQYFTPFITQLNMCEIAS